MKKYYDQWQLLEAFMHGVFFRDNYKFKLSSDTDSIAEQSRKYFADHYLKTVRSKIPQKLEFVKDQLSFYKTLIFTAIAVFLATFGRVMESIITDIVEIKWKQMRPRLLSFYVLTLFCFLLSLYCIGVELFI